MNLQYKTGYPYAVSNVSYPSIGLPMFPNGYPDINTSIVKYIPQEPNTRLKDNIRKYIHTERSDCKVRQLR